MNEINENILGVLIGILLFTSLFMFMALINFIKKSFVKIFNSIDALVKRINTFLDTMNIKK